MTPPRPSLFRRLRLVWVFLLGLLAFDLLIRANSATWERHSPDGYTERVSGCAAERRLQAEGQPDVSTPERAQVCQWLRCKESEALRIAAAIRGENG